MSNISQSIDVVISTCGRGTSIDAAISSLRANTHQQFTLWVFDQSKECATRQCVMRHAAEDERIRYYRAPERGLCATRNLAAGYGNAPYILFTNDDMRLGPTWISEMVDALVQFQAHAVFGRVLADSTDSVIAQANVVLGTKDADTPRIFERNWFDLGFGHGHSMGVTRAAFEQLHGFDELLGAGAPLGAWDDRDYGYRVLINRGRIVYAPRAVAYHRHWQDWAGVQRSYANYGIGAGAAVAKYVRCGRPEALAILAEWMLSQGVRQSLSGALKSRNMAKVRTGLSQFAYPIAGFKRGLGYPIERATMQYCRGVGQN